MSKKLTRKKADGSIDLRVDLKPQMADIFMTIIEERQFQSFAEAVRYCIVETHKKTEFQLEESYYNAIKRYLNYDYVKKERHIYNMIDFVNKALENFFNQIDNSLESILSFDIRAELNDEELEIAMAFLECQENSELEQATAQDVANQLNRRNLSQIDDVLNSFVDRGMLSKLIFKGDQYFHAKSVRYS